MTNALARMAGTLARVPPYMRPKAEVAERPTSKTERMREYLREHGPTTSAVLAMECDVPTCALVGALLKGDLARGSVWRDGDRYAWDYSWDDQLAAELRDARALLVRHGYRVTKDRTRRARATRRRRTRAARGRAARPGRS